MTGENVESAVWEHARDPEESDSVSSSDEDKKACTSEELADTGMSIESNKKRGLLK